MKHIRQRDVMGHGLAAHDRVEYVYGQRPAVGPQRAEDLPSDAIEAWYARHPEATCTTRTARALAWIEEFRP